MDNGEVDEEWFPGRCVFEAVGGECIVLASILSVIHVFDCLDLVSVL